MKTNPSKKRSRSRLDPNEILIAEFEYARETAAQAMNDRHIMVNYYLLIVGIGFTAITGLINVIKDGMAHLNLDIPLTLAFILFTVYGIGVLFLLKLVRLRQAWHHSARAMNQIKDFYDQKLPRFELSRRAFLWSSQTLPGPQKKYTIFFFSALLIIFLASLVLAGAIQFITTRWYLVAGIPIVNFVVQIWLYQYLLSKNTKRQ